MYFIMIAGSRETGHKHEFVTLKEVDVQIRKSYADNMDKLRSKLTNIYSLDKELCKNRDKIVENCESMRKEVKTKAVLQVSEGRHRYFGKFHYLYL